MRWSVSQRLEFIEFRLLWEGHINRIDIMERFDVAVAQASMDLKQYKKKAPGNMRYNRRKKQYFATPKFKPVLITPDANAYLSQINMLAENVTPKTETSLGHIPDFDILPSLDRSIDTDILKKIIIAIRDKKAIEVEYQSMTRSSPMLRWLTPHAFVNDGFRWHVRAHCVVRDEFRDFILGRIIRINDEKKREIDPSADDKWHKFVKITIAPNPALSNPQKKVIEHEYGMKNGRMELKIRGALIYYMINRFRLENENLTRFSPQQNLIIVNNKEVDEFI